jgi:hypothetical protein
MSAHGVLIPVVIAAKDIDSLNRSAISALDFDNGNVMVLNGKSATAGESEVWTGIVPSTSNGLTGLWMAYEPEIVVTTSGSSEYKGLDPNPQNFYNINGDVFSIFRPQLGDILTLTADALSGAYSAGVTTHVNATNSGGKQLVWANAVGTGILSLKFLAVSYISLATGGIDTQRVTAYTFEVVVL